MCSTSETILSYDLTQKPLKSPPHAHTESGCDGARYQTRIVPTHCPTPMQNASTVSCSRVGPRDAISTGPHITQPLDRAMPFLVARASPNPCPPMPNASTVSCSRLGPRDAISSGPHSTQPLPLPCQTRTRYLPMPNANTVSCSRLGPRDAIYDDPQNTYWLAEHLLTSRTPTDTHSTY
jgi:hypothetical protein